MVNKIVRSFSLRSLSILASVVGAHIDAFLAAPLPYLTTVWWRARGKRVRARAHFSRLLSLSPRAYAIWLNHQVALGSGEAQVRSIDCSRLIVIVQADRFGQVSEATLQSISDERLPYFVVGGVQFPSLQEIVDEIEWNEEPWFLHVKSGDLLAKGAAGEYGKAVRDASGDVIYADDDILNKYGSRENPHFKPSWNRELFKHHDYLTWACAVRVDRSSFVRSAEESDWASSLVVAAIDRGKPHAIPKVLHHRKTRPSPIVPLPICMLADFPLVSVIIPTRNRHDLLQACMRGLKETEYPNLEVVVVDNQSDDTDTLQYLEQIRLDGIRVLDYPHPFNYSAINNFAVGKSRGELICLMNNDVEVLDPSWLRVMVAQAMRHEVGAVGAQLLYPDGRIQHAGVVLGICGGAAHAHRLLRPEMGGYFSRHNLPQFTSAVTAACLVVQRSRFLAVGGLDETHFPVAFNDVDLCMRLNAKGWQSLYEPRARLVHHESVSRGFDQDPVGAARFARELENLQRLWGTDSCTDPFHHPELSPVSEHFVVRLEPDRRRVWRET